jgi:hypothetical protein
LLTWPTTDITSQVMTLRGIVTDAETHEPLPFVTVSLDNVTSSGTMTDIHGEFSIQVTQSKAIITFSYVGYYSFTDTIDDTEYGELLHISFQKKIHQIQEVVVNEHTNPANELIRKGVRYSKRNNPEQIPSYSCRLYNKTSFGASPNRSYLSQEEYDRIKKMTDSTHLLLIESVVNKRYIRPGKYEQKLEGLKVSGFKKPTFAPSATDIQPFHFYDNYLVIYDKSYLNPISRNSQKKYIFELADTLFIDNDTTYVIGFRPGKGKNFDGLRGQIQLTTNKYAIRSISASPADSSGLVDIAVHQHYRFVDSSYWFPVELSFELRYKKYPGKKNRLVMKGVSYVRDVNFNIPKTEFNPQEENLLLLSDSAYNRTNRYWENNRFVNLSSKDSTCYTIIDSLGEVKNFDKKFYCMGRLFEGNVPVSIFDIPLISLYDYNVYEGNRYGFGLQTNDRLSEHLEAGAWFAYGTNDSAWKKGGHIDFIFDELKKNVLSLSYRKDVSEPAEKITGIYEPKNYLRSFMSPEKEQSECFSASYTFRLRYLTTRLTLQREHVHNSLYSTPGNNVENRFKNISFTECILKIRYAYQEELIPFFGEYYSNGSDYPIISAWFISGRYSVSKTNKAYTKTGISIHHECTPLHLGNVSFRLESGLVFGEAPYTKLYAGIGSYDKNNPYYVKNTFNTMGLFEFTTDKYVNVFISHNFGKLLLNNRFLKPEIVLLNNFGYGWLDTSKEYIDDRFQDYNYGFFETGVMINNIVRINVFNFAYLGLGGGAFYRYGAYSHSQMNKNICFKLGIGLTL